MARNNIIFFFQQKMYKKHQYNDEDGHGKSNTVLADQNMSCNFEFDTQGTHTHVYGWMEECYN